jgi:heme a synthase
MEPPQLGRVIGIAYLLPFLGLMWRGELAPELPRRLWLILGLGGLQGAIGWWMVASGLSERVEVSQCRLPTYLVLALVIFASIVWTLARASERPRLFASARLKSQGRRCSCCSRSFISVRWSRVCEGKIYNTWPDIDGGFIASTARLFFERRGGVIFSRIALPCSSITAC